MNKFLRSVSGFFRAVTGQLSLQGWLFIAAMIAVVLIMSTCSLRGWLDRDKVSRGEVIQDQKAREQAADSRLTDTKRQDQMRETLNEAVASLPDNVPSDRRLAIACQRLRNDGHTELPASCGPAAHRQAPPRPG